MVVGQETEVAACKNVLCLLIHYWSSVTLLDHGRCGCVNSAYRCNCKMLGITRQGVGKRWAVLAHRFSKHTHAHSFSSPGLSNLDLKQVLSSGLRSG
jgi:hypothetical protein